MSEATIFKYTSPESFERKVDEYFKLMKAKKSVASMTGLALHLGCTRKNLVDYKKTDAFGPAIERAKLRCENILEEKMISGTPPTGIIFILKNNYGWHDKVESEVNLTGTVSLAALFDKAAKASSTAELENPDEPVVGEVISEEQITNQPLEELPDDLF